MEIGALQAISLGIERPATEQQGHSLTPVALGTGPKGEGVKKQSGPIPPLIPEHEVEVQWDKPTDQILIYRIVDKGSGALVLQVPSVEVLSSMHQTREILQKAVSRKAAAVAAVAIEKSGAGR
jgi:hypothetical protein